MYAASSNFSRLKPAKMQRSGSQAQHNQQNVNPNVGGASSTYEASANNEVKANLDSVLEIGTDKRNSKNSNRGGKRKKIGGATDAQNGPPANSSTAQ